MDLLLTSIRALHAIVSVIGVVTLGGGVFAAVAAVRTYRRDGYEGINNALFWTWLALYPAAYLMDGVPPFHIQAPEPWPTIVSILAYIALALMFLIGPFWDGLEEPPYVERLSRSLRKGAAIAFLISGLITAVGWRIAALPTPAAGHWDPLREGAPFAGAALIVALIGVRLWHAGRRGPEQPVYGREAGA